MRSPFRLVLGTGLLVLVVALLTVGGRGGDTARPADCSPYARYGGHDGASVSVHSPFRDREAEGFERSWADFAACTGIDVRLQGDVDFEAQIQVRADGGDPPDLALFPQPGLLERFARAGRLKPVPAEAAALVAEGWPDDWSRYGAVDGTLYATPLVATVKSLVWYSPRFFAEHGLEIPRTWPELTALTERLAASGPKPWCAGFESAGSTGWPGTDWIEDVLLRTLGPDGYDDWTAHRIPFDDPRVVAAFDEAGAILKNDAHVAGGSRSIATTPYQDAGLPVLTGDCAMHRQASFYAGLWPEGTRVGPDGDVFAFPLPGADTGTRPLLGGGVFAAAFADRPEVRAFQEYLATGEFAESRLRQGGFATARRGVDPAAAANPIDRLSVELLQDPATVLRFDGSDLMPASVGTGSFWEGMTDWITGADSGAVAAEIERSWPRP
ncbi:ABC transporter substrate-binding protein [Actinocorallia aurea]